MKCTEVYCPKCGRTSYEYSETSLKRCLQLHRNNCFVEPQVKQVYKEPSIT